MDAEAFPRREPPGDINRLAGETTRKLGDRSVREDDRFLFLQLLAAAGDAFYLSYGGRDARDGSVREPSALVSELLDVAQRCLPAGVDARERLLLAHPLQPFSAQAFGAGDARRFSYRAAWRRMAIGTRLASPALFVDAVLPPVENEALSLSGLRKFLRNPAKDFLQRKLGLQLPRLDDNDPDAEPLGDDRRLRHRRIMLLLDEPLGEPSLRSRALLPPGNGAQPAFVEARDVAERVSKLADAWLAEAETAAAILEGVLVLGGHEVPVRLGGVHGNRRAVRLAGRPKGKYRIDALIEHLAFAALRGNTAETAIFHPDTEEQKGEDGKKSKVGVARRIDLPALSAADAKARLEDLFALRREGGERPLAFVPDAACVFVEALKKKKEEKTAYSDAIKEFESEFGEGRDRWFALALRPHGLPHDSGDPVGADFRKLARRVFDGPSREGE
jgi:exodeoxyribonuclease V gamma subunit